MHHNIYNYDQNVEFWATPPIHGCLIPEVIFPDDMVFKIPDNLSFAEGAMVEPLAVGMQGATKSKIKPGQILMVGHIFLYNDRLKKVKSLLSEIGNIQHIESNRLNWGRFQKKISTLHSLAPHDVSIIHYLLGYHEFQYIINIGEKFTKFEQI